MDRPALAGVNRRLVVNRLAEQVEDTAQVLTTNRYGDGRAGVDSVHAAHQAVGGLHCDAADGVLADVLRDLYGHDMAVGRSDRDCVQQFRQGVRGKFDIQYRSNDLDQGTNILLTHWQNSLISVTLFSCPRHRNPRQSR